MGKYDDIIDTPYPFPAMRERMSRAERASQFLPFAALTGYDELISEASRHLDKRHVLSDDEKEELDDIFKASLIPGREITITYFVPDEKRKDEGIYKTERIGIRKFEPGKKLIVTKDNECIFLCDIIDVKS